MMEEAVPSAKHGVFRSTGEASKAHSPLASSGAFEIIGPRNGEFNEPLSLARLLHGREWERQAEAY